METGFKLQYSARVKGENRKMHPRYFHLSLFLSPAFSDVIASLFLVQKGMMQHKIPGRVIGWLGFFVGWFLFCFVAYYLNVLIQLMDNAHSNAFFLVPVASHVGAVLPGK